jgi:hypothetical protein
MKKGQPGFKRFNKIAGQFSARLIEMMESPAFRVLSLAARRMLDRIEIEHAHHGGQDNGKLPVTFNNFVRYGIHRHAIGPASREIEMLGFVRITERGRAGNREFRTPNKFALTYRATTDAPATNDWRRIQTMAEAEAIAKSAREVIRQKQKTSDGKRTRLVRKTHQNGQVQGTESVTTGKVRNPSLLSISRVGTQPPPLSHTSHPKNSGRGFSRRLKKGRRQ